MVADATESGRFSLQECQFMRDIAKNRNVSNHKSWTSSLKYKLKGASTVEAPAPERGYTIKQCYQWYADRKRNAALQNPVLADIPVLSDIGNPVLSDNPAPPKNILSGTPMLSDFPGGDLFPAVVLPRESTSLAKMRTEVVKLSAKLAEYQLHQREDHRAIADLLQKTQDQNTAFKQGIAEVIAAAELQFALIKDKLAVAPVFHANLHAITAAMQSAFFEITTNADVKRTVPASDPAALHVVIAAAHTVNSKFDEISAKRKKSITTEPVYVSGAQTPPSLPSYFDDLFHDGLYSITADVKNAFPEVSIDDVLRIAPTSDSADMHAATVAAHTVNAKFDDASAKRKNSIIIEPVNDSDVQKPPYHPSYFDDLIHDGMSFSSQDGSSDTLSELSEDVNAMPSSLEAMPASPNVVDKKLTDDQQWLLDSGMLDMLNVLDAPNYDTYEDMIAHSMDVVYPDYFLYGSDWHHTAPDSDASDCEHPDSFTSKFPADHFHDSFDHNYFGDLSRPSAARPAARG